MMSGRRRHAWLIAALLGVYLILAAVLPAADDEVYYWAWARPLQFSYYDHPPMTAYMIRGSVEIFGDSIFGFRVPACLASVFVVSVIARLSRPKSLLPWIILTPLFTLGAVMITPDAPLLCAWAAYVWWLVEVHRRLTPLAEERFGETGAGPQGSPKIADGSLPWWMWLVGGVILGCGVLGKYTMALAVPSGFATFCVIWRQWKKWLPGYIAHGVVSFIVASPILIYNIQHEFVPLLFQWRHSMGDSRPGLKPFGEFVGVQLLLFGTLPFFLYPWVLWRFRSLCENPRLRVCACLYALPMTFFLYKSTRAPLQGNWALVMFVSFWPLAAVWYESVRSSLTWRRLAAASFLIPAAAVLVLAIHVMTPLPVIPAQGDRVTRQYALYDTTQQIARRIRERGEPLPVFTPTYQLTAWLRFQSLDGRQIDQISRPSHFTQHPEHLSDVPKAYVVADFPLPDPFAEGFEKPELIETFPVVVRGEKVRELQLLLYSKAVAIRQPQRPRVTLVNHEEVSGQSASGTYNSSGYDLTDDAIRSLAGSFEDSKAPHLLNAPPEDDAKPASAAPELSLRLRIMEATQEDLKELGVAPGTGIQQGIGIQQIAAYDPRLDELKKAGKLNVKADASLSLRLNKRTHFFSGSEFPVPVPDGDGKVGTEFREVGFFFNATPSPEADGRLRLEVEFSASEIDMANAITLNGTTVPGISRRGMKSTINISPGEGCLGSWGTTNGKCLLILYEIEGDTQK